MKCPKLNEIMKFLVLEVHFVRGKIPTETPNM